MLQPSLIPQSAEAVTWPHSEWRDARHEIGCSRRLQGRQLGWAERPQTPDALLGRRVRAQQRRDRQAATWDKNRLPHAPLIVFDLLQGARQPFRIARESR